ncbi:MAG: hypothetical protein AB7Q01_13525 [Gammaproteobacteria bacterium]
MNTRANILWFAASSRWLAVVFSIFFLLAGFLPSHANARFFAADRGAIGAAFLPLGSEDQPSLPDGGLPDHLAGQCACGVTVLPDIMAQSGSPLVRPVQFSMRVAAFVPLGAQAPPGEPPRT